jgi:hypothetical protein
MFVCLQYDTPKKRYIVGGGLKNQSVVLTRGQTEKTSCQHGKKERDSDRVKIMREAKLLCTGRGTSTQCCEEN